MHAQTFLDNFGPVADAPGGVDRLRELVLELAISGHLVGQSSDEVPVGPALAEVCAEKGDVLNAKVKGRSKVPREPESCEVARPAPPGWSWARIDDTGEYVNGLAFKQSDWHDDGLPIIRIQNLTNPAAEFNHARGSFPADRTVDDGDILVSWSATLEAFVWDRGPALVNQHIFKVIPDLRIVTPGFLFHLLRHTIRDLAASDAAHGLAMKHINRGPFVSHVVGIPPLAEQARIVAKIDELMQLCDDLEARQQARHHVTTRLRASSLDALTSAETDDDLHTAWSRIHTNWEALTDHPDSIDTLRQAILQLAVRGKLVDQRSAEGCAEELLVDIAAEREQLLARGLMKKPRMLTDVQPPYALPPTWRWVRFGSLLTDLSYGTAKKCRPAPAPGFPVLRIPNIAIDTGGVDLSDLKYAELSGPELTKWAVATGDLLIIRSNGSARLVGRSVVVPEAAAGMAFAGYVMRAKLCNVDPHYIRIALETPGIRAQIEGPIRTTSGVKNVNSTEITSLQIPLPPLAEQRRISSRVGHLHALSDRLSSAITDHQAAAEQLAECLAQPG